MNPLRRIRIVLVRPIYGGNIGSVCRAMKNFGLRDLVIAGGGPREDMASLHPMAAHAHDIWRAHRDAPSLADAVADCGLVVGTTGRGGLYRSHAVEPRRAVPRILTAAADRRVALVFGPEDDGLTNEDLALCPLLIRIPNSPAYPSMNLAMAVAVCAYELYVTAGQFEPPAERTPEATMEAKARLFDMWRQMLLEIGFMQPHKADHMMLGFLRAFSRGPLSDADVRLLMGVCRQARWLAAQYRRYRALADEAARAAEPPPPGVAVPPPDIPHAQR
ncbi:MAG: RNA methyltransferase [Kiritimatiellae bacterium]|nr:RNA methyltransferase [Kiritimatiellia bacterium]